MQTTDRRLYVGTSLGALFQVNYSQRQLEAIYQLHDSAINSVSVSPAFCATASSDGNVRVWPLDFSDYFLSVGGAGESAAEDEKSTAKSPSPMLAVANSPDALQIACASANGTVGVVDLELTSYRALSRGLGGSRVLHISQDPLRDELAVCSKFNQIEGGLDSGVRVWGVHSRQIIAEFVCSEQSEHPTCSAFIPVPRLIPQQHTHSQVSDSHPYALAVGTNLGHLRLIDLYNQRLISQVRPHGNAFTAVLWGSLTPTGDAATPTQLPALFTLDNTGLLCMYDVAAGCAPLRTFGCRHAGVDHAPLALSGLSHSLASFMRSLTANFAQPTDRCLSPSDSSRIRSSCSIPRH